MSGVRIRKAAEPDVPLILSFIRKLAEYERKAHQVTATEEGLREALFRSHPAAEVLLAFVTGEPVGFALYFWTFSTFRGRRGLFLEDLFVEPAHQRKRIGTALMEALANVARERGCNRLEWWVLKWNQPAIDFYRRLGAAALDEWSIYRLEGDALGQLAGQSDGTVSSPLGRSISGRIAGRGSAARDDDPAGA
jgi:GNAT superfamily N-acetyltransferase